MTKAWADGVGGKVVGGGNRLGAGQETGPRAAAGQGMTELRWGVWDEMADEEAGKDQPEEMSDGVLDVDVGPEEVLEVELEGEEGREETAGGGEGTLGSCANASGSLPPVEQYMVTEALAEELPAVCAYTKQPFVVSAVPAAAGAYDVVGAKPLPPGVPARPPAGKGRALSGVFRLERYHGCPHCGAAGLILCQDCGTISCGAVDAKTGQWLPCPGCGSTAPVSQSKQGWTVHVAGKGKGKSGKA